jgi:predicted dehydrogenase
MRYALIGCGRISPNHIAAAKENGLEFVALCDIDETATNDKIIKFGLPSDTLCYTDYKKMLSECQIDLIAIATESGKHAQIALDCIEYGVNLIIEKPIALSIEDADAIILKAKEKGVRVSACHQNRFNKSIAYIRSAFEKQRFGRLFYGTAHIRWNRGREYYNCAKWRGTWAQDGGALMNQCIHNIDLLTWMLGEPTEVFAYTDKLNHDYIEAEDLGIALLRFKNGAYGIIEGTTDVYPTNLEETLYLFGEKGTVKAGGQSVNTIEEWRFSDMLDDAESVKNEYHENPPNVYGYGHIPLYTDVIEAIETNQEPYVTAKDGKRALEIILAIYRSAAIGQPVNFPLETGATVDYTKRFI